MEKIKNGDIYNREGSLCVVSEIINEHNSHLDQLRLSELHILNTVSANIAFPGEECILFNLQGTVFVTVQGKEYEMKHYDTLYVSLNEGFQVRHEGEEQGLVYVYRATGTETYPVFHSQWEKFKKDKSRIRYLNRKEVFIMFDVGEKANKFIAGYTFYQDHTRAWPPHNHTDQEEIYSFIEGRGAMSVYPSDEEQTFVTSVEVGDHVSIPLLNYHPVFSDSEPLTFIWCIAGERYWVGDKNKDFMDGKVSKLTT